MTNTEIAISLINTFGNGDITLAQRHLAENYIQHNLSFESGRKSFIEAVKGLQQLPIKTTVENIRSFEDGNYVVLQSLYNFAGAGDQIGFDVFRFENGKIADHWDNLTNIEGATPSGHTQSDGATDIVDLTKTEANKKIVSNFVRDVLRGDNPDALSSYFDGDNYIQHNVGIADGLSGLGAALKSMAEQGVAMVYDNTFKILGHGNFVLAMSEGNFGGKHVAFYDMFNVINNKIIEHWDIIQEIPDESAWKNKNGKF